MESPNQKSLERDSRPPRTDASWILRAIRDTLKITGCFNLPLHARRYTLHLYSCFFSFLFLFSKTGACAHPHLFISSVKSERVRAWGAARLPPFARRLWSNRQTQQDEALWCWRQQQVAVNQRTWKRFGAQIFVPLSSSCCKTPIKDVWPLIGVDLPWLTLERVGGWGEAADAFGETAAFFASHMCTRTFCRAFSSRFAVLHRAARAQHGE